MKPAKVSDIFLGTISIIYIYMYIQPKQSTSFYLPAQGNFLKLLSQNED